MASKGRSKNRMFNIYIWDENWFSDLEPIQKLVYNYIFSVSSNIGIYQHNKRLMHFHTGADFELSEIITFLNLKREVVWEFEADTIFLNDLLRIQSKSGTKIKPNSNPNLGLVREAISTNLLNHLINVELMHYECKYFEFGIQEAIINNTSYSSKRKKNGDESPYKEMVDLVIQYLSKSSLSVSKVSSLTEGLVKPWSSLIYQEIANRRGEDLNLSQEQLSTIPAIETLTLIEDTFHYNGRSIELEQEVGELLQHLSAIEVNEPNSWVRSAIHQFISEYDKCNDWEAFLSFISMLQDR